MIPVDDRAVEHAPHAPPPMSGGTLAATPDGRFAIAADPDRDRVSIVDLKQRSVRQIMLSEGDEPGRVVTDASGHAYVALRRAGDVIALDVADASLLQRVHVCAAPRGLALQPERGSLHVACSEGRVVTLHADPNALAIAREVRIERDLRDVLVNGDELQISTFKSAELLSLSADGKPGGRAQPRALWNQAVVRAPRESTTVRDQMLQPHIARRMLGDGKGDVFMLHQGASTAKLQSDADALDVRVDNASMYGAGASGGCFGVVVPEITRFAAGQDPLTMRLNADASLLDMALSSDGSSLAVVAGGAVDPRTPLVQAFSGGNRTQLVTQRRFQFARGPLDASDVDISNAGTSDVIEYSTRMPDSMDCEFGSGVSVPGQATSLVFVMNSLLVQSREPALLTILSATRSIGGERAATVISLGGASMRDTGHELFHRDAGGGVACVSCHPEGGEDGHVWRFETLGDRRTPALNVGLEATAPFDWSGDEASLTHMIDDLFVRRMGGVHPSEARADALVAWLASLQPTAADSSLDPQAVERGRALFESEAIGCATCHAGDARTNNQNVDLGAGEALQVPSLRGVASRAPFMHDGCADSLRAAFGADCGGPKHGHTAGLSDDQFDDLITFVKTL